MRSRYQRSQSPRPPIGMRLKRALDHAVQDATIEFRPFLDFPDRYSDRAVLDGRCALLITIPHLLFERIEVDTRPPGDIQDLGVRSLHGVDRLKTVSRPSGAKSISGATTRPSASQSNNAARTTLMSMGWNAAFKIWNVRPGPPRNQAPAPLRRPRMPAARKTPEPSGRLRAATAHHVNPRRKTSIDA